MFNLSGSWKALYRRLAGVTRTSRLVAQSMVEYGLLVALVAVAALGAIQALGGGISSFFGRLLAHFQGLG